MHLEQRKHHIVACTEMWKKVVSLEHDPDFPPVKAEALLGFRKLRTVHENSAGIRSVQARKKAQQRGFSAT